MNFNILHSIQSCGAMRGACRSIQPVFDRQWNLSITTDRLPLLDRTGSRFHKQLAACAAALIATPQTATGAVAPMRAVAANLRPFLELSFLHHGKA